MEITLKNLVGYCRQNGARIQVDEQGEMWWGAPGSMLAPLTPQQLQHALDVDALGEIGIGTGQAATRPEAMAAAQAAMATLHALRYTYEGGQKWKPPICKAPAFLSFEAPGYEALSDVLLRAFVQASAGKGRERHAQGEPFTEQVMQDMARRFGVGALLGQAFKKSEESQRLPHDKAVAELLGAINYLAGAVIAMELRNDARTPMPVNDNAPCCSGGQQSLARCTGCIEAVRCG